MLKICISSLQSLGVTFKYMMFQREFDMAIGWMFNTGIYQKMLKDVTTSTELRAHFEEAFWVPNKMRTTSVLTMKHLLMMFLMLVVLLAVSIAIFLCEIFVKKNNKPASLGDIQDIDQKEVIVKFEYPRQAWH